MFQALAGLLAFFYSVIPSYGGAIVLLTVTVMLVLTPLTWKSTRSMLEMQRLQPEIKRLQQEHKNDRQKLNEELMAFYKEHKVNPVAGCLPVLLQMPVFLVMYRVLSGLTHRDGPQYLDRGSKLYQDLVADDGRMVSFGMDLAKAASAGHASFLAALPFFVLVALVVATQYIQTKQMSGRNPGAEPNPQMLMMQRVFPAFFGFIGFSIPAGLNVYFLFSSLFRIVQQELMYRFDPVLVAHVKEQAKVVEAKAVESKGKAAQKRPAPARATKAGGAASSSNGARSQARPQKKRAKKGR